MRHGFAIALDRGGTVFGGGGEAAPPGGGHCGAQGVGAARSAEVRTMLDDSSFPRDN
jgi:hypothetical protein